MILLGLDVGTTGTKCVAWDESGNKISSSYREHKLYHRNPGWSELDPREVWNNVVAVIRECSGRLDRREIRAISTSVLGEAFILVDRDGEPLYPSMTTVDSRARRQVERWMEFGRKEMYEITGQPLSELMPIYPLHKIEWIRENEPEIFKNTWKFMCWEEYVNYKLTGKVVTDRSIACRTMMFDLRKNRWSDEVLDFAGLSDDLLAEVSVSGKLVGSVSEEASKLTNLPTHVEVVSGAHDQPSGALGAGMISEGPMLDATGTVECFGVATNFPLLSEDLLEGGYATHSYVEDGKFFTFGFSPTSGAVLRWFRDNFGGEEIAEAERTGKDAYEVMIEKASNSPVGSRGLIFLPHFEGRGTPRWDCRERGCIFGLSLSHTKEDLVRSILESLSFELRMNVEFMRSNGIRIDEIRAIGGGAKSEFWIQMKSDVCGIKILVPSSRMESASLGAAILASVGCGIHRNLSEAVEMMCRVEELHEPNLDLSKKYEQFYQRYREVYLKQVFDEISGNFLCAPSKQ